MSLSKLWQVIHRRYQARLFEYPSTSARSPAPEPPEGYRVEHYTKVSEVPEAAARITMPGRFVDLMRGRMNRGKATLLVMWGSKGEVAAYCWIQSWKPYARCFSGAPTDGCMVGFGWVNPEHRRRGLFTWMCRRGVIHVDPSLRPYGIAVRGNGLTPRACISAGYTYLGEYDIHRWLWFLRFSSKIEGSEAIPTLEVKPEPAAARPVPTEPRVVEVKGQGAGAASEERVGA